MLIKPGNKKLQYSGRIDWRSQYAPVLVFPCSYIKIKFQGTFVKAIVENHRTYWNNYLGCLIDGKQTKILLKEQGKETILLAENLENTVHELTLFKRMDSCHTVTFYGFEIDDEAELFTPEEKPARKIEVYGDSVSAGEVSEAVDYVGQADPEHNGEFSNSYYSYAWMTARKLGAQIHDIAQGGVALLPGTGWFSEPDYIGMVDIFDKIQYNVPAEERQPWDFSLYRPQVVIVAIGQNDNHPVDYMAEDYLCEKAVYWRKSYKEFIEKLRSIYPRATIILATTILEHHENWDKSIDAVCSELQDEKIHHFLYSRNGKGTPGHIRIPEAEAMADELASYIESLGEGIWMEE